MLVALRAAASPALRAWIDANLESVLAAAAPAFLATAPPKLIEIADGVRRQSGGQPGTKYIWALADALGITVTPGTRTLRVDLKDGQRYTGPNDYADLVADFDLQVETVTPVTTAISGWTQQPEPISYERRKAGADKRAIWYAQREQYTGPGLQLSGEASARIPGVYVNGPGLPTMFFYCSEARWYPYPSDAVLGEHPEAPGVALRRMFTLDPKPDKHVPRLVWDVIRLESLRPLVAALIGKVTADEEKRQRERAKREALLRDTARGSCAVCFRPIALSGRLVMEHGYRMAGGLGHGHRGMVRLGGACDGSYQPPWEASAEGAAKYAADLRAYARTVQADGEAGAADKARRAIETAERYEKAVKRWPIPAGEAAMLVGA